MWPALVAERGRLRNLDLNPYLAGGSFFTSRGYALMAFRDRVLSF